jgi:hypothetical protein
MLDGAAPELRNVVWHNAAACSQKAAHGHPAAMLHGKAKPTTAVLDALG